MIIQTFSEWIISETYFKQSDVGLTASWIVNFLISSALAKFISKIFCSQYSHPELWYNFYPFQSIDGNDVKDLNLRWLRSQIAIVSQEPVLFDMTIKDNIAYAYTTGNLSDTDIIKAAKLANIHEFIMSLPKVRKRFHAGNIKPFLDAVLQMCIWFSMKNLGISGKAKFF